MIKVVEVSSDSNIGGAGKCILTFLKFCDRTRFQPIAVVPRGSLLIPEIKALDVEIIEMDNLAEKSLDRRAISALRKLFKKIKPDLVHTHASMSARIAAKTLGIPVVYTRHSVFPQPKKLTSFPGKQINGFINNITADKIIAVAEAAKDNLTETGVYEKKIEVILNGVEPLTPITEEELSAVREQYGIEPDEKVAVMAARLTEVKGHKFFVEAAKRLKEKGVRAKFIIAGTGDTEDALKAQIKENNLEDTVIMAGFIKNVAPLMNLMDVQVNCSFGTEATSLALLEGMSLGKPIIASRFGGNPGVVQDGINGYLTPICDTDVLTERLEKLMTDETLYKEMSQNCKKIFNEKFTASVNTRTIEDFYERVLKAKKGGK
ncbi:MAG: glycosyltransferase family 4 protein [Clostridia bacterium]|nr:glycosyltransferase family 4 protein [Clostridia bacterium]